MEKRGMEPDAISYSVCYVQCVVIAEFLEEMREREFNQPNVISYNAVIIACKKRGK